MTVCQHCRGPVEPVELPDVIPYRVRWAHVAPSRAHGYRTRPGFVTCPTGTTTATPA